MSSLFGRKKSAKGSSGSPPSPPSKSPRSKASGAPSLSTTSEIATAGAKLHLDDFGREIKPQPAFLGNESKVFGSGYGVGEEEELQLLFGYGPIETTRELSVGAVGEIVGRCSHEIRTRGLSTPLILSSMALDITLDGACQLIRSYLADRQAWAYDLHLAVPLSVGAHLKWGLARLVNDKGERGFLSWDTYASFKAGEKAESYPARYCTTHLITRLPNHNSNLLGTLLELFSSVAAYSASNGMTPRKLASLFSPYVFGLADDQPFDATYQEWQRGTDALEHIILSFIRDQKAASGQIPTHLEKFFIAGYPRVLNISYSPSALPKVPKGARVEEVTRVRRLARFHSRNLIQNAGSWEVPHSPDWSLFFPPASSSSASSLTTLAKAPPIFTPQYRHLLNIRSNSQLDGDDDEGEMQRYKTVVEKEWGKFGDFGFKEVDAGKLEFDLTEGERSAVRAKHETMDWGTFASSGFAGRETFAPADLIFHQNISQRVNTWPASQKAMSERLHATEKALPAFPYDTTPHEEGRLLVDANWFEVWADVLVSGGWARDELKESSFAFVQWKGRARDGEIARGRITAAGETRTEDRWVLVEEFVPKEYRDELRDGKKKASKRISFMRAVRRKSTSKPPPRLNVTQITHSTIPAPAPASVPYTSTAPRRIDESVFTSENGLTKMISLSSVNLASGDRYAPSIISTTGAGHGHAGSIAESQEYLEEKAPSFMGHGVGGTLSSQNRESAFGGAQVPVGYTKPAPQRGFLARIGSRKAKNGSREHFIPVTPVSPAFNSEPSTPLREDYDGSSNGTSSTPTIQRTRSRSPSSDIVPPLPPSKSGNDVRASVYSGTTVDTMMTDDDPYGGIEDEDVQEGTVLFRGSRSSPHGLDVQAVSIPGINVVSPPQAVRPLPTPPKPLAPINVGRPARHESLPPSPKPDAEVPVDEEIRQRDKFMSGSSQFSTRVAGIVGLYENRDSVASMNGSSSKNRDVRLTQFGFGATPE